MHCAGAGPAAPSPRAVMPMKTARPRTVSSARGELSALANDRVGRPRTRGSSTSCSRTQVVVGRLTVSTASTRSRTGSGAAWRSTAKASAGVSAWPFAGHQVDAARLSVQVHFHIDMAQAGWVFGTGHGQRGQQWHGGGLAVQLLCRCTGQHHAALSGHGGGQGGIAGGVACVGFGEQHRHADGTGPGLVQAVDHPGMQLARPGPAALVRPGWHRQWPPPPAALRLRWQWAAAGRRPAGPAAAPGTG